MEFCVDFAKLNIKINSKYDYTYNFCREFETKGKIDFEVETTDEKIDKEIENSEFNPPRDYA
ncbi:MAG: hypothetical protein IKI34_03180, partial [Eubacterium sp.]|nr:hypothetical protein [Eubacterium sp.]